MTIPLPEPPISGAYFSESLLKNSIMKPGHEAMVKQCVCPMCRNKLTGIRKSDDMEFSQCARCGDIFVIKCDQAVAAAAIRSAAPPQCTAPPPEPQ